MPYKVNKSKCTGCQICIANCPGATKIGTDGKAEVINQEQLEQCGGESICPIGAIEKIIPSQPTPQTSPSYQPSPFEGRGIGKGMGAGRGRGFGIGPRDGRGGGRGGGGRN